jgi:uncharacterized protein YabN with tetrapyrrole methylase and pyrophosphatase domain
VASKYLRPVMTHDQITVLLITGRRYFDATHNQITVLLIAGLRYFDATHDQITVLPLQNSYLIMCGIKIS